MISLHSISKITRIPFPPKVKDVTCADEGLIVLSFILASQVSDLNWSDLKWIALLIINAESENLWIHSPGKVSKGNLVAFDTISISVDNALWIFSTKFETQRQTPYWLVTRTPSPPESRPFRLPSIQACSRGVRVNRHWNCIRNDNSGSKLACIQWSPNSSSRDNNGNEELGTFFYWYKNHTRIVWFSMRVSE